jgi:hypothetical protein
MLSSVIRPQPEEQGVSEGWLPAWESESWGNELVVGQSQAGKNVNTEVEDTVVI